MKVINIARFTLLNKCPRCGEGRVFENNNPYHYRNGLAMHKYCPACGLRNEKETGFFYGAMYVSYGLVAGLFVLFFALDTFFFHLEPLTLCLIFSGMVLALFPVNYRWSRTLWIAFFAKYEGRAAVQRHKAADQRHLRQEEMA